MWRNFHVILVVYGLEMCWEWQRRGYQDNTYFKIQEHAFEELDEVDLDQNWIEENRKDLIPSWLGDERLHLSHQSMLYQKDSIYYKQWSNVPKLNYWWPKV